MYKLVGGEEILALHIHFLTNRNDSKRSDRGKRTPILQRSNTSDHTDGGSMLENYRA